MEEVTAGEIRPRAETLQLPVETSTATTSGRCARRPVRRGERARAGEGPQFIEALTYRFVGHSRSDPGAYRKPGELDAWRERDPLKLTRAGILERYDADEATLDAVESDVERQMKALVEAALAAPFPTLDPAHPVREFKD